MQAFTHINGETVSYKVILAAFSNAAVLEQILSFNIITTPLN